LPVCFLRALGAFPLTVLFEVFSFAGTLLGAFAAFFFADFLGVASLRSGVDLLPLDFAALDFALDFFFDFFLGAIRAV